VDNSNRLQQQIDSLKWCIRIQKENDISCMLEDTELSLHALEEKQERENLKPLTLAQLKQMEGEAVWCKVDDEDFVYIEQGFPKVYLEESGLAEMNKKIWIVDADACISYWDIEQYGKDIICYAHKPKED